MHNHTLVELSALLQNRSVSSMELTEMYLRRSEQHNPELNCYITLTREQAMRQAEAADHAIAQGTNVALTGIPIVHKDIFCTDGVRTTCGSRMLENFIAPYDATVVEKLNRAGMVMLGKTNMDEFAMGSSSESSWFGPVRNPWDHDRVPGGSSGGSAAAVAARLTPAATGTDTGGSIRQPSALSGITGLKPTYGRVSRYGMIAFASSLDQGGVMARTAADVAMVLEAIAGFDPRDSTSVDCPGENYRAALEQSIDGLVIGLPVEYFNERLDASIQQQVLEAVKVLEQAGASIREISLPNSNLSIPAYYVIAPAECSSNLSRYDGIRFGYRCDDPRDINDLFCRSRSEGFGAEVKRRIMTGTYVLSAGYYDAYYLKAQKIRHLIQQDFRRAFSEVDVIAGPTSPTTAFKINEKTDDPISMYLNDVYTVSVNLAGLPAVSIPAGFTQGLPVGLQVIGDYFTEARLLNIAHWLQKATDWHTRAPGDYT